jgi:hypothetical protein
MLVPKSGYEGNSPRACPIHELQIIAFMSDAIFIPSSGIVCVLALRAVLGALHMALDESYFSHILTKVSKPNYLKSSTKFESVLKVQENGFYI